MLKLILNEFQNEQPIDFVQLLQKAGVVFIKIPEKYCKFTQYLNWSYTMDVVAESLYIVTLRDAPSNLPEDAKLAAEARYARELERALGGQEQVASALDAVLSLEGADIITKADQALAERWQKASATARERALTQIGEVDEAYFDVRLA